MVTMTREGEDEAIRRKALDDAASTELKFALELAAQLHDGEDLADWVQKVMREAGHNVIVQVAE